MKLKTWTEFAISNEETKKNLHLIFCFSKSTKRIKFQFLRLLYTLIIEYRCCVLYHKDLETSREFPISVDWLTKPWIRSKKPSSPTPSGKTGDSAPTVYSRSIVTSSALFVSTSLLLQKRASSATIALPSPTSLALLLRRALTPISPSSPHPRKWYCIAVFAWKLR